MSSSLDKESKASSLPALPFRSRLLLRGLSVLEDGLASEIVVRDFIVLEDSVFVLSDDWDAQPYDHWNDPSVRLGHADRTLILYEFDRWGSFRRRLSFPLVQLRPQGYDALSMRHPERIIIRKGFLHFSEALYFADWEGWIRIDYIFTPEGQVLARWTDQPNTNDYLAEHEGHLPVDIGIEPEWIVGDMAIAVESPGIKKFSSIESDLVYCSVSEVIEVCRDRLQQDASASYRSPFMKRVRTSRAPFGAIKNDNVADPRGWTLDHFASAVSVLSELNDPYGAWFLVGRYRTKGTGAWCSLQESICRIREVDGTIEVSVFATPDPDDFMPDLLAGITNSDGPIEHETREWSCWEVITWDNWVIMRLDERFQGSWNSKSRLVLFNVINDRLELAKLLPLDPPDARLVSFSGSRVYWKTWDWSSDRIFVMDVNTEETYSFVPRKPTGP